MPPSLADAQLASSPSLKAALSEEMGLRTQQAGRHRYLIVNATGFELQEVPAPKILLGAALLNVGPGGSPELLADVAIGQYPLVVAPQKAAQRAWAATSASKSPFLSSSQSPGLKMKADTVHVAADLPNRFPLCDSTVHSSDESHFDALPHSGSVLHAYPALADFAYFDFQNSIWPTPSLATPRFQRIPHLHWASSATAPSRYHLPGRDMN